MAREVNKPSDAQLEALRRLALADDGRLIWSAGGLWVLPGTLDIWDPNKPRCWWAGTRTVQAMESRGWLQRVGRLADSSRDDRQITDEGRLVMLGAWGMGPMASQLPESEKQSQQAGAVAVRSVPACPACGGSFRGLVRLLRLQAEAAGTWLPKDSEKPSQRRGGSHGH